MYVVREHYHHSTSHSNIFFPTPPTGTARGLEKSASLKDDLSEYREKLEKSENQNDALEATIMARDEKILESEKKLEMTENQIQALEATIMARDEKIREIEENRVQEMKEMEQKIFGT